MALPGLIEPLDEEGQVPGELTSPVAPPEPVAISDFEASTQELPPEAPLQPEARPQPDPAVLAMMDADFAPRPDASAPGFASWADMQAQGKAPQTPQDPGDFSSFMEQRLAPQEAQPFDLKKEEAAYAGSPVPEEVSQPDLTQQEQQRLAGLNPDQFLQEQILKEDDRARHLADVHAQKEDEAAASQAEAATTYKDAVAKTQAQLAERRARIDELSQREPEGFFEGEMTASKVTGLIKAIAIGLVSPLHGLVALNNEFNADQQRQVQAQQMGIANLGKQASILQEELAIHGDLYKAQQTVNLAWKQKLPAMLAAEMSKYDAAGSTAMKIEQARRTAMAEAAQAHAKNEKDTLELSIKAGEFDLKQRADFRAQKKFEREMAPKPGGAVYSPEQLEALYGKKPPMPMSDKQYKDWLGVVKDVAALDPKADPKSVAQQQQVEQFERGSIVTDSAGSPIGRARYGPEDAVKLAKFTADYEAFRKTAARLADIVKKAGRQYGGIGSGRWPTEERTQAERLATDLAVRLAKIRDPESVAREGEVALAAKDLPSLDTWTSNKNPITAYKTIVKTADDAYDAQVGTRIEYLDPKKSPTRLYQSADTALLAPSVEPAEEPPAKPDDYDMLFGILPVGGEYSAPERGSPEHKRSGRISMPEK